MKGIRMRLQVRSQPAVEGMMDVDVNNGDAQMATAIRPTQQSMVATGANNEQMSICNATQDKPQQFSFFPKQVSNEYNAAAAGGSGGGCGNSLFQMATSSNEFSMSTASENNNTNSNSQQASPNKNTGPTASQKNFISAPAQTMSVYDNTLQMMMRGQGQQQWTNNKEKTNQQQQNDMVDDFICDDMQDQIDDDNQELSYMHCAICNKKQLVHDAANEETKIQQNQNLIDVMFSMTDSKKSETQGVKELRSQQAVASQQQHQRHQPSSSHQPKDLISLLLNQKCQSCEKYTCEQCLDSCDGCSKSTCRMCIQYVCAGKIDGNYCYNCTQTM